MRNKIIYSLILLFTCAQASAFAETIEGRVAGVSSNSLGVTVYDPQGRPYPNTLNLVADSGTRLVGVPSSASLRRNDPISAEVHQLENGAWHADKITLFQNMNAQPATKNPPPTMRDILGNPVVRGALTGAATGAIASSASGGKAGKGALIGAGVGAAAGLLENIFSQNSQNNAQQSSSDYSDNRR
jgi:hypothetical protein